MTKYTQAYLNIDTNSCSESDCEILQEAIEIAESVSKLKIHILKLIKIADQGYVYMPFLYDITESGDTIVTEYNKFEFIGFNKYGIIVKNFGGINITKSYSDYGKTWAATLEEFKNATIN